MILPRKRKDAFFVLHILGVKLGKGVISVKTMFAMLIQSIEEELSVNHAKKVPHLIN